MTHIVPILTTCGVCGAVSEHEVLGATSSMGPPDLDMRPAPMARWTLSEQMQQCPECGYCARDISVATEVARQVARNDAYQALLAHEDYPELTRKYLCASLILSVEGEEGHAGRAALMGAWAADDVAEVSSADPMVADDWGSALPQEVPAAEAARRKAAAEAAAHCRRLAIGYFEADRKKGLSFAADIDTADAMLADLHRRVGDFESARACARAGIDRGATGFVLEVFRFELLLCDQRDVACHNSEEAQSGLGGLGFDLLFG